MPPAPLQRALVASHFVGWSLLFLLSLGVDKENQVARPFLHSVAVLLPGMALFYANQQWLVPRLYRPNPPWRYFLAAGLAWLLASGWRLGVELVWFPDFPTRFYAFSRYLGYVGLLTLLIGMVSGFASIVQRHRTDELRALQRLQQQQEHQLRHLREQINPHFLFNALNNIYALALTQSEHTAPSVRRLSNLLRFALYHAEQPLIRAGDELHQVRELLELFRLRVPEALDIRLDIQPAAEAVLVEPMLVLPLVENALKHGDLAYRADAFLQLSVRLAGASWVVHVVNTFTPHEGNGGAEAGGIGLNNIQHRLHMSHPPGTWRLHRSVAKPAGRWEHRVELVVPANHFQRASS